MYKYNDKKIHIRKVFALKSGRCFYGKIGIKPKKHYNNGHQKLVT